MMIASATLVALLVSAPTDPAVDLKQQLLAQRQCKSNGAQTECVHRFGAFGVEADIEAEAGKEELLDVMARTEAAQASAGFSQQPKIYFQLAAQH